MDAAVGLILASLVRDYGQDTIAQEIAECHGYTVAKAIAAGLPVYDLAPLAKLLGSAEEMVAVAAMALDEIAL